MTSKKIPPAKPTLLGRLSHFLIIFAYLWLLLTMFTLHNSIVMTNWELAEHLGSATLKALVFAKFILIGEHLKLGSRAEHLALIWIVLIKAALFAVVLIGFNLVEEWLVAALSSSHGASAHNDVLDISNARVALSLMFMTFVTLIPFFGIRELSRLIGPERMRALFFQRASGGTQDLRV
jgi:hypothetical protein